MKKILRYLKPFKPVLMPIYRAYKRRFPGPLEGVGKSFAESFLIKMLFRYRDPGVLIDVGAHFGTSFRPYERQGWKVFAFEPDPSNRSKIKALSNQTEVFDLAVSDKDDLELEFFTSSESTGISGIIPFHATHKSSFKVRTITLRTWIERTKVERVDFLKIDTEGNDLPVLQGFPFERVKPKVILCEFEDAKSSHLGYSYQDLGNFLLDRGYRLWLSEWHPIVKYGLEHSWNKIYEYSPGQELSDPKGWGNFIAVQPRWAGLYKRSLERYISTLQKAE